MSSAHVLPPKRSALSKFSQSVLAKALLASPLLPLLLSLFLTGCSFQQRQVNALADNLAIAGPKQTLQQLEAMEAKPRDRAQYLLNRGSLKQLNGNFRGSSEDWQQAKQIINSLQASSISENLGSVTINETLRSFIGSPSEQVLLHGMLAINYLQQQDLDAARVEMLQAEVTMQKLAEKDSLRGQLASINILSGLIYELNQEPDSAMISYRRALNIIDEQQNPAPQQLQISLLTLSQQLGLEQEYDQFRQRFNLNETALKNTSNELWVLYSDGVVSRKQQHFVSVFSPENQQFIALALPFYPPANYAAPPLSINIAGQWHRTDSMENINQRVRSDLKQALPLITATTLTRAVAKFRAADLARKEKGDLAGLLVNIGNTITEQADLRSWNMLPASLQIARIPLPPDVTKNDIITANHLQPEQIVSFNKGKQLLLISNSFQ